MKKLLGCVFATPVVLMGGCPLPEPETTVEFRNQADSEVRAVLYYGDDQDTTEDLLREFGRSTEITLAPGELRTFGRECGNIQAILVDAELRVLGDIGPEDGTELFRDGDDFGCGSTVRFTFSQNTLGTDLDIAFTRQSAD